MGPALQMGRGRFSFLLWSPCVEVSLGQCPRAKALHGLQVARAWGQAGSQACARWQERCALGGSGTATLRPGCATHSTLSPRPAAWESSLALAEDPSLQFLGIGCSLQLSFPGADAKQAPPQPLEGLQAFCVEHFSAAAGRLTSWGLEETQQPASVYFAPAVKRGTWLVLPDPHTGLAAPCPVGQAGTPLHQWPASCPQAGNLHRAFNF